MRELEWAQLRQLRLGESGEPVPRLDDVLEMVDGKVRRHSGVADALNQTDHGVAAVARSRCSRAMTNDHLGQPRQRTTVSTCMPVGTFEPNLRIGHVVSPFLHVCGVTA
ncbi:hypothetical protein [Amycolatopsis magusensis]|uniref:Transposase n=1 Tax=Amycolatopsis magusensis TaxID=882444 RepID=A0ABS4PU74_9PSEU|nr:hypothetical protein [Amycolatopsis magusensis]MBP2182976.1 hypothetical protein [Amycolatopsis magusensis]